MIGGATQKIQTVIELAESVYEGVNQLRDQIEELRATVDDTHDRVESIDAELADQRALLEALADESGIDPADLGGPETSGSEE